MHRPSSRHPPAATPQRCVHFSPKCGAALRWRRQGFGLHQPHHWIGPPTAHVRGCAAQMGARLGADTRTRLDRRLCRLYQPRTRRRSQTTALAIEDGQITAIYITRIPTSSATSRRRSRWHRSLPRGHSDQAAGAPGSACLTFSLSRCARSLEAEGNNRRGRGRLPLGLRLTVGSRRGAMSALPCCRSIADRRKTTQSSRSHRRRRSQSVGVDAPDGIDVPEWRCCNTTAGGVHG